MNGVTFDSLAYFEELKAAGVPERQARVQADTLRRIIDERLVTREYLDTRLRELEYRLTIRLGCIVGACTALLLAGLPLLLK